MTGVLQRAADELRQADLHRRHGRVTDLIGLIVEATGLEAEVGEVCHVAAGRRRSDVPAEVVGFRGGRTLLMPLGDMQGIAPGRTVTATGEPMRVPVGDSLLGRVLDGLGRPIDGMPDASGAALRSTLGSPPDPLSRPRIEDRVTLGVRALDGVIPCGRGQRLGIFAGSGVGKSSLLGMIARSASADVNVIALVGERGREVREFIERDLGDALRAQRRRRRHLRPARPRPHQGRVHGHRDRRALPRPGRRRDADDGLGDARGHGPARGRPGRRRAARHPRLHAERLRPAAAAPGALGHEPRGRHHRAVHRARGRRRHERAGRRRGALDPRRPRRAQPPPRARRPLPGHRRAAVRLAPDLGDRAASRSRTPAARCGA